MHDQNKSDFNEITEQINMFYDASNHKKQVIIEHLDTQLSDMNACDSQYLDQSFDIADNDNSTKNIYDFSALTERQVYPKESLTERSSLSVQSVNIPENEIVSNFIMNMSMLAENQAHQSNSIHIEQQINKLQMNLLKNNKKEKHRPLKKKVLFLRSKNNQTNKMPKKLIVRQKQQKQKQQQQQQQKYKQLTVKQLSQISKINQKLYNAYIVVHRLTKKQQINTKQINQNLKQLKIKQNHIKIQKQKQKQFIEKIKIQSIQYQQKLLKIENQIIKKQKQMFIQNYYN